MKIKLGILTALLMMSFCANGQTGTDSVLVPKRWLREGMKDLIRFDQCREERALLKQSNDNLQQLNSKLTEFSNDLQEQKRELTFRWQETIKASEIIDNQNKEAIKSLEKQLSRQKTRSTVNTLIGVLSGVGIGIITGWIILN